MPGVDVVDLRGACSGSINGFKGGKDLKVNVEGASTITGEIQAGKLTLEAGGASQIKLTGKAHECRAEAQGASQLHLGDLAVEKAVVQLDGASSGVGECQRRTRLRAKWSFASRLPGKSKDRKQRSSGRIVRFAKIVCDVRGADCDATQSRVSVPMSVDFRENGR